MNLKGIDTFLDDLPPIWIACFRCGRGLNLMSKEARSGTTEEGYLTFVCPSCRADLTHNAINMMGKQRYRDISIKCLYMAIEGVKGGIYE